MTHIAARAHIGADRFERRVVAPQSVLKRVLDHLVKVFVRRIEDDITERYRGSAWCDSVEHDLNRDVMTGRRTRR
jgi:hypothetical protein